MDTRFKIARIVSILAVICAIAAITIVCKAASPADDSKTEELDWRYPDRGCYLTFATVESSDRGVTKFVTRDGNVFVVDAEYDPDLPYLLTMYGNYTDDVTDDEVCVVWTAVEGALG